MSESGSDDTEEEELSPEATTRALKAPSGLEWHPHQPQERGRQPSRNIFTATHVGFSHGFHPQSSLESFRAFFGNCLELALLHSNREGRRIAAAKNVPWRNISASELDAFIGLHLISGAFKSSHRDTRELWSVRDGHPIFRAVMSFKRFQQIKAALRFDNKSMRDRGDPLSPIRQVVDYLNENLGKHYTPGSLLCVDEQLVEYHGRVSFRQYIPSKPGKFGIKVFWITDVENTFPLRCIVYIGKKTFPNSENNTSISERVVMHLAQPFLGVGRNITTDNWFTSIPLSDQLEAAHTSLVGTIRSSRRDIPPAAKDLQGRCRGDSKHFDSGHRLLCSF